MIKVLLLTFLFLSCVVQTEGKKEARSVRAPKSACSVDASLSSPTTIDEATALINALPKPLSLSCFLESLARPLKIYATNSDLSIQPAHSNSSPRIFIFSGELIMAIVPEGSSSHLLEYAQLTGGNTSSIKGEVEFPVPDEMNISTPYVRVESNMAGSTTCSSCHGADLRVFSITHSIAYRSEAFKPRPETKISFDYLKNQAYLCQLNQTPSERCDNLRAIFHHGEVLDQEFPADMDTFF